MKAITTSTEKLVLNENYTIQKRTTYTGFEWNCYIAKIENTQIGEKSLEDLQAAVSSFKFETPEMKVLKENAVNAFGTNA